MLSSIEEALFEVVSWLLFWPKTFLVTFVFPQRVPAYVDGELAKEPANRYAAMMPPIAFLIVTQAVAAVLNPDGITRMVTLRKVRDVLDGSIEALIALHALIALIVPLAVAAIAVRTDDAPLDRDTLQPRFLKQCYVYTVHVCMFNFTSAFYANPWIVYAIPIAWLIWAETLLLREQTGRPWWQSFLIFAGGYIAGLSVFVLFILALNRFTMFE